MKDRTLPNKIMNNILAATAIVNHNNPTKDDINSFDGIDDNIELVFEPVAEFGSCGNTTQRSRTFYKNVEIIYDIFYPWNILKKPVETFSVCLLLPIDTKLENGVVFNYYAPEGFGSPDFKMLKDALKFIDDNPDLANNTVLN